MEEEVKKACALHFSDRITVVSRDNKPLMPCKPSKAKKLLKAEKAEPRWSKLGLFYIQLTIEITSELNANQYFILANDPGSRYDGFALGCKYVQLHLMAVMPEEVHGKMDARRNLRRARRYRGTRRRPWRSRSPGSDWIAPSQLAKVLFRLAIVRELCKLFPVKHFIVEDVKLTTTTSDGASIFPRWKSGRGIITGNFGNWALSFWRKAGRPSSGAKGPV